MRKISSRRIAKSSNPRYVNKSTLYSKQSVRYYPKVDVYHTLRETGREVPYLSEAQAKQFGLVTRYEFADHIGMAAHSVSAWLARAGIEADAVLAQPRYGHHKGCPPYLYKVEELAEAWRDRPLRPRTYRKDAS